MLTIVVPAFDLGMSYGTVKSGKSFKSLQFIYKIA